MKFQLFVFLILACAASNASARMNAQALTLDPEDTLVFDIDHAVYSTVSSVSYIEIPVLMHTINPAINAIDWWFHFDLNKMTYVSTTSAVSGFDVFSYYNTNNQTLSNSSSTTSLSEYLPWGDAPIMTVKFSLNSPCTDILPTDFNTTTALFNGIVSSSLFTGANVIAPIQIDNSGVVCAGSPVTFSYGSTINWHTIASYSWDFGNTETSTGQSASVSYADAASYLVTLNITTLDGCTYTLTTTVDVQPTPTVAFDYTINSATQLVTFSNSSTIGSGGLAAYDWNFDDGNTSSLFEPTHTYAGDGSYNVSLTVTSDLGCVGAVSNVIIITDISELTNSEFGLKLYPNPANSLVSIQTNLPVLFYLTDAVGRRVVAEQMAFPNSTASIDVSNLASGIYTMVYHAGSSQYHAKLMVQK